MGWLRVIFCRVALAGRTCGSCLSCPWVYGWMCCKLDISAACASLLPGTSALAWAYSPHGGIRGTTKQAETHKPTVCACPGLDGQPLPAAPFGYVQNPESRRVGENDRSMSPSTSISIDRYSVWETLLRLLPKGLVTSGTREEGDGWYSHCSFWELRPIKMHAHFDYCIPKSKWTIKRK